MIKAYLGLGSNMGASIKNLQKAVELLRKTSGMNVTKVSSTYKTSPVGYLDQPNFYNCVIEIQTSLLPEELLVVALDIEKQLHRIRDIRWGPRTMDIDILCYGEEVVNLPQLQIPHPRMNERGFVLVPLYEIAGDLQVSGLEHSVSTLLEKLPHEQRVELSPVQNR